MNGNMRGFVFGILQSLVSKAQTQGTPEDTEPTSYNYDSATQTLTVNEDDGSLSFAWDWDTMKMEVEANGNNVL